jgi:hypothetical protein
MEVAMSPEHDAGGRDGRVRPVYVEVGIWFSETTEEIHMALTGFKDARVAISSKRHNPRGHPELYRRLALVLREAGAPSPGI